MTIFRLGLILLGLGLVVAIFGFLDQKPPTFGFGNVIADFYVSVSMELVGIGFTVLILDKLYEKRNVRREKQHLVTLMASGDVRTALEAVERLRAQGWLGDGTLRNQILATAMLAGADLRGADLQGANLRNSQLTGVGLQQANLVGADLEGANLADSNLGGALLSEVQILNTDLRRANLEEAEGLAESQLRHAEALMDATLPDGRPYDGRFNLAGDLRAAATMGFQIGDTTAMARFYGVPLAVFERNQRHLTYQ